MGTNRVKGQGSRVKEKTVQDSSKPDLSIVILSFNVKELLLKCLESLYLNMSKGDIFQVIVVDNDSKDESLEAAKKVFPQIEAYQSGSNLGFSGGNNFAVPHIKSDFVLFLNPDTVVEGDVIQRCLETLKMDLGMGAITCRVEFPNGQIDYSTHRGIPTPWNSLMYFTGLSRLFPHSKLFSGYTASYLDTKTPHEVDCVSGVFLMLRKEVGEAIHWWDQDYFWNGEDIEFCYRLKEKGWKIFYFPYKGGKIIHYKGSSSGLWSTSRGEVPKERKIISAKHAASAMRIFYKKHFYKRYPVIMRDLVLLAITLLEKWRIFKISVGLKYK